jgi:CubicO group peptidase (beta-lactamase class C family)
LDHPFRRSIFAAIVAVSVQSFAVSSSGQKEGPTVSPAQPVPPTVPKATVEAPAEVPSPGVHNLTRPDAEAWLDGFMPYALQRGDVAGAVVVIVKDGNVLLQKGYGYSNIAEHKPVDPERTLFRPGSVSKLFTWTAVMQLVEQGKLDLDADVNTYLDFKIPPRDGKPVTLRNLMTHTPGFDEAVRALFVSDPKDLPPLEEALKYWVPTRVTPSGSTPAYSNYGAGLAGLIVQRVSGESFDDYIEKHILAPLRMEHSTFRQPLPQELQPWMSKGYEVASDEPKRFELVAWPPAGALSASGGDMAHFMIAHLQNGAFDSSRILQEDTAKEMHTTAATVIPPLNRMLLGFYENNINGHPVISHGGDTGWFHSWLNLFIDDGVGLYVSLNSAGKDGASGPIRDALFREFADRYFPGQAPQGEVDAETARRDAQLMTGRYAFSRRSHTTFLSLANLLGQTKVTADADGAIAVSDLKGLADEPKNWREIAPYVWRDPSGARLAAKVENGRVTRFGADEFPFMLFEPVPWWWSAAWLLPLWIISLVALVVTVLAWPISAFVRRYYKTPYGLVGRDAKAHRAVRIGALLVVVVMLVWLAFLQLTEKDFDWIAPSMDVWIIALRLLTLIIFAAGAAIALWNLAVVLRSQRRWLAKVWSVALAIFCLCVLYVGVVFHLVGYTANY